MFNTSRTLPSFRQWIQDQAGIRLDAPSPPSTIATPDPPVQNPEFFKAIEGSYAKLSMENDVRVFHSHGHTCEEIYAVRCGRLPRVVDAVVFPGTEEHVVAIVRAAATHGVVIIPFGGGTSVSEAILCPPNETRTIVSLSMKLMDRILWINRDSSLACIQAGAVGLKLEAKLRAKGFTLGHEPDSMEFSTLGGWISTRASGMKKNQYGNIEDIIVNLRLVTPAGVLELGCDAPRVSVGPDLKHFVMGSEGTLGVITSAVVRLRRAPEVVTYDSALFPSFEAGVRAMREVADRRLQPASIRLVDNLQFQFGQALKPFNGSKTAAMMDHLKKTYVTQIKKFDPLSLVAATMVFEGEPDAVAQSRAAIARVVAKHGGFMGGAENGRRGYALTYMIAYIRDFGMEYNFLAESFETSVPWGSLLELCDGVKARVTSAAVSRGVHPPPFVSCRVTQVYDSGACVYFYFGFNIVGLSDPAKVFHYVETEAREEVLRFGGSLSHHHGVGKLRKQWLTGVVSPVGVEMLKGVKKAVDPTNVFANGNLY